MHTHFGLHFQGEEMRDMPSIVEKLHKFPRTNFLISIFEDKYVLQWGLLSFVGYNKNNYEDK